MRPGRSHRVVATIVSRPDGEPIGHRSSFDRKAFGVTHASVIGCAAPSLELRSLAGRLLLALRSSEHRNAARPTFRPPSPFALKARADVAQPQRSRPPAGAWSTRQLSRRSRPHAPNGRIPRIAGIVRAATARSATKHSQATAQSSAFALSAAALHAGFYGATMRHGPG
jgi:hypothetical protein